VQNSAKESAVESDFTNLKVAVVAFQTQNNGDLPAAADFLDAEDGVGATVTIVSDNYADDGLPSFHPDGTDGFCIEATAATDVVISITDKSSPARAACS